MGKKLSGILFRKTTVIVALILLQLEVLLLSIWRMARFFPYVYLILLVLSGLILVRLINSDDNPSYKLAWCIPILILPIFGGFLYLLFGTSKVSSRLKKSREIQQKFKTEYLSQDASVWEEAKKQPPHLVSQMRYVKNAGYPLYRNEEDLYFPLGDDKFPKMLTALKNAKKYIFLEYFIIADGVMWSEILSVLQQKVAEGVEVRVIFDDCGSLGLLPNGYEAQLQKAGIQCRVFNPLRPSLTITMNNRDHRKILIVDGTVGFTGGVNIGDEYINKKEVHGHWKDAAVMFRGQAVNTLISLFFEMWNLISPDDKDVASYYPAPSALSSGRGYLQPYGSDPFGEDKVSENVYLNIISKATKELFILTPYLIIDNELTTALCLAAKNGVEVNIVTPHVADKWYVHLMTVSSYPHLIKAGVNIYEYTPGFLHSKVFCADGEIATVGTVNMDYRSLYLHFECGVILYGTPSVKTIREDCQNTIAICQKITSEDCNQIRWYHRLFQRLVRLFSPLM